MYNNHRYLYFLVIVLLVWGCTPFRHIPDHVLADDDMVMLDVPFVPQAQDNDCGPAALASVLKFYGVNIPLDELTAEVYIPALNRTLLPDMENYARDKGFETSAGSGSISLLTKKIDSGHPVIILMDAGSAAIKTPHYIVVWGYNSKGFLAHAGYTDNVFISFEDLDPRWQRMNRLYLVLEDISAG